MNKEFVYYKNTSEAIRREIESKFNSQADCSGMENGNVAGYLLWMLDEIGQMDKDIPSAIRAGRWMGWVLRVIEDNLGFWDNNRSRKLIRKDVEEKYDYKR